MADSYTVEYSQDGKYAPAPEGLQQVVCVDGIFLGKKVETFPGSAPKMVEKYALIFQTSDVNPATGQRYELQKEFTISMSPKANLRKFLSAWRGKQYTDEEAARVELHKIVAAHPNGLATVEHKTSAAGRLYGIITNLSQLAKSMPKIDPLNYERGEYWEQRKEEYAKDVAAHMRAMQNGGVPVAAGSQPADRPTALVNTPGRVEDALTQAEKAGRGGAAVLEETFDGEGDGLPF